MMSGRLKYFIAAIGSTIIWGMFSIPIRNLKEYPPYEILDYRLYSSLIVTWLFIILFRRDNIRADFIYIRSLNRAKRIKIFNLLWSGSLFLAVNWLSFLYVVNSVSLKTAAFSYVVCPLITAMAGFFILKEHLSTLKWAALCIAFVSVILLAQGSWKEVCWALVTATSFTFYAITQRLIVNLDKLNVLGVQLMVSTIVIPPLCKYFFGSFQTPVEISFWVNIMVIAVIFTVIPFFLVSYSLIGIPSSTLGIIIYINPIIAFAIAFIYFGEKATDQQICAYGLLGISILTFNWRMIRNILVEVKNKGYPYNKSILKGATNSY